MYTILAGPTDLGADGIATLSRPESKTKWYVTLTQATLIAHYNTLHGKTFLLEDKQLQITIEQMNKDRVTGT